MNGFTDRQQLLAEMRNGESLVTVEAGSFSDQPGFSASQARIADYGENPTASVIEEMSDVQRRPAGWAVWDKGQVGFVARFDEPGAYEIVIRAWAAPENGSPPPKMTVSLKAAEIGQNTIGATQLRQQLIDLHTALLGREYPQDHPEIEASFNLLLERWQQRWATPFSDKAWSGGDENCWTAGHLSPEELHALTEDPERMTNTWTTVFSMS